MSLTKGKQYDASTGQIVGDSTLPMHDGLGTKGEVKRLFEAFCMLIIS
jgi:hypothetical protein